MTLPSSGAITLQQIQSEYSTSGLRASSTAAGLDPLPTSMRDFMGLTNYVLSLNVTPIDINWDYNNIAVDFLAQSFGQIEFRNTGVLGYQEGDNQTFYPWTYLTDSWIDSTPNGGNRASIAANYDFEWEFVSGDVFNKRESYASGDVDVIWTHQIGPAFGTRVNLGSNSPILVRLLEIENNGGNPIGPFSSEIYLRSKIYQAGTNTLVSNVVHHVYLQVRQGAET